MDSNRYEIEWHGPYRLYGTKDEVLFATPEAKERGIYLQTIPFGKKFLTYYVGETGRTFARRFTEHTRDYLYGLYRIYDPHQFPKGAKILLWEGMWKPGTRDRIGEFLNRYSELAPLIYELLGLFRIFIAPLDAEKRIRQRIEGAIAHRLYQQPGIVGAFQENDIRYSRRRADEEPISVTMKFAEEIIGLCNELTA